MNFSDLQTRVQDLCSFAGWTNINTAPSYTDLVNRGYRQVCWNTEVYKTTTTLTTVANQNLYTLSGTDIISVYDCIYGTTVAMFPSNELEQRRQNSLWMYLAAGSPRFYWMQYPNAIYLHPKPSASGDTVNLYVSRLPADMSSNSDLPVFPVVFHDAIAYRAACLLGERYATGEEMQRLQLFRAEAERIESDMMNWIGTENKPVQRMVANTIPRRIY